MSNWPNPIRNSGYHHKASWFTMGFVCTMLHFRRSQDTCRGPVFACTAWVSGIESRSCAKCLYQLSQLASPILFVFN